MAIETLDDIVEQLMDNLGFFGAHDERCDEENTCRCCAASGIRSRILAAVEVEQTLYSKREMIMAPLPKGVEDTPEVRDYLARSIGEPLCPKCGEDHSKRAYCGSRRKSND